MKVERGFIMNGERYDFDFGQCSAKNGFAQVDTGQDAPYFGVWTNPFTLTTIEYCEGDVFTRISEDDKEYVESIHKLKEFHDTHSKFIGIDTMLSKKLTARFTQLGLAGFLH